MSDEKKDDWDYTLSQISLSIDVPMESDKGIPWFYRPTLSPPPSPRTTKALEQMDQFLIEEVTWRSKIPNNVSTKICYGINKVLTNNRFREKIPKKKEFDAYVESIDRTMLSLSNSIDEYLDMTNFKDRIADAIKYKSFINKVK